MKKLFGLLLVFALLGTGTSIVFAEEQLEEIPFTEWELPNSFSANRDDPVTLHMYMNGSWLSNANWGKDAYSRWLEQETGIHLEFSHPDADDQQQINLMIASGELPDLIFFPDHTVPALGTLINEGYLLPLNDLIDKYAPTMKEVSLYKNNWPFYEWEQGGTLYYLPTNAYDRGLLDHKDTLIMSGTGYFCREDIWKELGEPDLTTWDGVEETLYKVKAEYPEIVSPLIIWDPYGVNTMYSGTNMIYRSLGGRHKYILGEDGRITSQVRDPLYLEALYYINKLIKDGIIGLSDYTDSLNTALTAAMVNGEMFMSAGPGWEIISAQSGIHRNFPDSDKGYMGLDHMALKSVGKFFNPHYNLDGLGGALVITEQTKHPDRAIQLLEFLSTFEAQMNVNKGIQGLHWEYAGPTNRWMVPIGKAKEIMDTEGYSAWTEYTGGNCYRWVGSIYGDSAAARGDGMSDPVRKRIFEIEATVDDFSAFSNIDPMPGTDEGLISTKFVTLWQSYLGKVVVEATSFENAQEIWDEFLAKADQLELPKLEDYWTTKYNELQTVTETLTQRVESK